MMEAPKRIYHIHDVLVSATGKKPQAEHYIRADLVERLIEYAEHDDDCKGWLSPARAHNGGIVADNYCTCGLSNLIKEVI